MSSCLAGKTCLRCLNNTLTTPSRSWTAQRWRAQAAEEQAHLCCPVTERALLRSVHD